MELPEDLFDEWRWQAFPTLFATRRGALKLARMAAAWGRQQAIIEQEQQRRIHIIETHGL